MIEYEGCEEKVDKLVVLCLLGDPALPAASIAHTGGFQVDVQELLNNIQNPECAVHIITNTSKYCPTQYEETEQYIIHRVHFEPNWLADQDSMMKHFQTIEMEVFDILQNFSPEHTLIHSFYWLSGLIAMDAMKALHINYVHSVVSLSIGKIIAGASPKFSKQFEVEKEFLEKASVIFSITEEEKRQLQDYYAIEGNRILVVGRGVHPVFLNPSHRFNGLPPQLRYSGTSLQPIELIKHRWWTQGAYTYVGRIESLKGIPHIIAAWLRVYEKYSDTTPPLWICGGNPDSISLLRSQFSDYVNVHLLEECEEQQKIVWWGYLDPAGINTLFLKTRVLVMHSQYEPGGRVLLEALAASIPVIATPNGFAKDMIRNGENGFLVPYGKIDELASVMEYAMQNTSFLLEMKEKAHNTYIEYKEMWRCYQKQFQVYQRLGLISFGQ